MLQGFFSHEGDAGFEHRAILLARVHLRREADRRKNPRRTPEARPQVRPGPRQLHGHPRRHQGPRVGVGLGHRAEPEPALRGGPHDLARVSPNELSEIC